LAPGNYTATPQSFSGGFGGYVTAGAQSFSVVEGQELTLSTPFVYLRMAMLHVHVRDQNGNPLHGAPIYAYEGGSFVGSGTSGFDPMFNEFGVAVIFVPASAAIRLVAQAMTNYDLPLAPDNERTVSGARGEHVHVMGIEGFTYTIWSRAQG